MYRGVFLNKGTATALRRYWRWLYGVSGRSAIKLSIWLCRY